MTIIHAVYEISAHVPGLVFDIQKHSGFLTDGDTTMGHANNYLQAAYFAAESRGDYAKLFLRKFSVIHKIFGHLPALGIAFDCDIIKQYVTRWTGQCNGNPAKYWEEPTCPRMYIFSTPTTAKL